MRINNVSGWLNLLVLLVFFIMGIMYIASPHKMLIMNFLPWGLTRFNGRQDRKAVWIARAIGIVLVFLCIIGAAFYFGAVFYFYS